MKWLQHFSPFFCRFLDCWRRKRFPFLGLVLAAMVGIFLEEKFSFPSMWILGGSSLLGGLLIVLLWKRSSFLELDQLFFFLLVACFFATLHAWSGRENPARALASLLNKCGHDISVEGRIVSEPKVSPSQHVSFLLQVENIKIDFMDKEISPVTMFVSWEGVLPTRGDHVRLRALPSDLEPVRNPGEFDCSTWLARQGVYTLLKMDPANPGDLSPSTTLLCRVMRWVEQVRRSMEYSLTLGIEGDGDIVKLLKALVLGIHESEGSDFLRDFQQTGTLHLFAVSGLHISMLATIIWFVLKLSPLPRWGRLLLIIPLLFFYVLITGCRLGSLRAATMTSFILVGFLFYRRPPMVNSLAAAAFLLLLWDTNVLFSLGWQFSFCVVLSILLLASPLERKLALLAAPDPLLPKKLITPWQQRCYDLLHHFFKLLAVSLAAWLGALFPSLYYFHQLSFSSLGANILAVPLAFLLLSLSVLVLLLGPFFPWIATVFNNSNWLCAKCLLLLVHGFALLPLSSLSLSMAGRLHPKMTIFDLPSAQALLLQSEGKTWLLNTGSAKSATQTLLPFFASQGINRLEGVIVTQVNAAHLGGAPILLEQLAAGSFLSPLGARHSLLERKILASLTHFHEKRTLLQAGDRIAFSKTLSAEILPFLDSSLVLKIDFHGATLLLLPAIGPDVEHWLLEHVSREQLQSSILLLPAGGEALEESFLKTLSPRIVIMGRSFLEASSFHRREEVEKLIKKEGILFLDQRESGALILDFLPTKILLHSFLKPQEESELEL